MPHSAARSFDSCPVDVRLVQGGSSQLNVFAVFGDAVLSPVLDIEWIVGVSRVGRDDWHDPWGQQEGVPTEDAGGAVAEHPDWSTLGYMKSPIPLCLLLSFSKIRSIDFLRISSRCVVYSRVPYSSATSRAVSMYLLTEP